MTTNGKAMTDNYFDRTKLYPPYGLTSDDKNSTDKKQSKKSASKS